MTARVLVVDDAPTVRLYHGTMLRDAGFSVDEAANGLEAAEAALRDPFDLYVIDVNMPKMDGYRCTELLRAEPSTAWAPILIVSTEDRPVDADLAYRAGANAYLVKPVAADRLTGMARILTGTRDRAGAVG